MSYINDYFIYLNNEITKCNHKRITPQIKIKLRIQVSIFKVSGYCYVEDFINDNYSEDYNYHRELYYLFEELSKHVFTIKTYKNWLNEKK